MKKTALLACAFLVSAVAAAEAHSFKSGDIAIGHPMLVLGDTCVQMNLLNRGKDADALTGATTEAAQSVAFVDRKLAIPQIVLEPGKPVAMKPKKICVQLQVLKQTFKADDEFELTLTFRKAPPVTVDVLVETK